MSQYIRMSEGPGSIGALLPGAGLWHGPTIGTNDPRRNISSTRSIAPLSGMGCGCGCSSPAQAGSMGRLGLGTEEEAGLPSWAVPVGLLALIGGALWWLKRAKARDEMLEQLSRGGY